MVCSPGVGWQVCCNLVGIAVEGCNLSVVVGVERIGLLMG